MVTQLRSRDVVSTPAWVRKFMLGTLAVVQALPMLLGGFALSRVLSGSRSGGAAIGLILFALLMAGSGIVGLAAVYQDWRYQKPFNQSWIFMGAILLNGIAVCALILFRP